MSRLTRIKILEDFASYDDMGYDLTSRMSGSHRGFMGYPLDSLPVGHVLDTDSNIVFVTGPQGSGKSTLMEKLEHYTGIFRIMRERESDSEDGKIPEYFDLVYDGKSHMIQSFSAPETPHGLWAFGNRGEDDRKDSVKRSSGQFDLHEILDRMNCRLDSRGGIYILDHVDRNLDPAAQYQLASKITKWSKEGNQFFVVSHSPIIAGALDGKVMSFYDTPTQVYSSREFDLMDIVRKYIETPRE